LGRDELGNDVTMTVYVFSKPSQIHG